MKKLRFNTGQSILKTTSAPGLRGVTLMEVLMSVMIMSIGVISLASLFPISILRGVQATQLTNATVLRYNAEALIDSFPTQFVFDPDGTLNTNGHIAHQRANRKYVVDPLGAYYATQDATGFAGKFGNDGSSSTFPNIPRYNAGLTTQLMALNFFTQQDSWKELYSGVPASITYPALDTITIDPNDISSGIVNLVEIAQTVTPATGSVVGGRILIYDSTGKQMQERFITGANIDTSAGTVSFVSSPLRDNGLYQNPSKIRIETLDPQYSYLLTVRRSIASDIASVDVVVFFRRDFNPEYEAIHQVENFVAQWLPGPDGAWGIKNYDDDKDGSTDEQAGEQGAAGSDDYRRRAFRVRFNTNVEAPNLKRGGYVFDAINARWYRIQKVENFPKGSPTADITLDQPIIESINSFSSPGTPTAGLILMPHVVQVYPLGNKTR
ncbi:type IV pilus modification PilV family protein [Gimesia panareensis]|uniref:type IV pilus modification PilV family protein n=1 Tax=Gimesia panareensis TaxID=2527978 RepID=UPI001187AD1A|nr:hypothetical protein [Gimesia panareensis]QDU53036.1 hypothetical protein Pan110_54190 [Gimesia panareensis]